ncbi:MlaC/ttg2D family ABC transporter substrate-binding protein [Paraburkholderia unamae]|uniref:Phospholipid transport system substrate-binding protein n=1 Tax=Paraburkholderia unamae TaxID=219649 RepID=A0ABX5KCR8_9BURK|nr:ABC transporter substrate-binding protein [Paraburkholderia unamae]PVX74104.1 phospholipid transport system substrate-binding protein [Paraburkholderia unamae]
MKKFFLYPFFAMFLSFAGGAFAQTVDTSNPDAMVKTITTQVMDQIKGDKSIQGGDIGKITQLVNEKILPYTDFRRTTQLAMGRNWRTATPEQQQQVIEQFKTLLIRTYSGALAQVRDQQIQYKPFRANPDDTDVVVRSTVLNNGQPIELDYRLYKTPQGWRVYDINVLGAWLIQAYQQQFQEKIQQGGVDGLIQFLTQRNQQLASGKATS